MRPSCRVRSLLFLSLALAVFAARNVGAQAAPAAATAEIDAKLAKYFEFYARPYTIEDRIAKATRANAGQKPKEIVISTNRVQISTQNVPSSMLPPNIPFLLLNGVANADLIVMGVPLSVRTLPIQNRTFLFSQYVVRVTRIFSDDTRGLSPGDTIIVSMGGGSMIVDEVMVTAVDPAFDQFSLHEPLILMLKDFPGTGTYRAVAPWTYEVKDGVVSVASKIQPGRAAGRKNLPDFLVDLERAVAYARSRRK